MKTFGLIGFPLSHSWSATFFTKKFSELNFLDQEYKLFPLPHLEGFQTLLRENSNLVGLNVTIPYKISIIPYLDELDAVASAVGAVNTILISKNSTSLHLKGYNTDVRGFLKSADFSNHSKALVLGTGGASKAVQFALSSLGIDFLLVSRSKTAPDTIQFNDITPELMTSHTLLINTTPIGMYPTVDQALPLPYHLLTNNHFLYDLIYNPSETLFLSQGAKQGARTQNGLQMLQMQAEESYKIWTGQR